MVRSTTQRDWNSSQNICHSYTISTSTLKTAGRRVPSLRTLCLATFAARGVSPRAAAPGPHLWTRGHVSLGTKLMEEVPAGHMCLKHMARHGTDEMRRPEAGQGQGQAHDHGHGEGRTECEVRNIHNFLVHSTIYYTEDMGIFSAIHGRRCSGLDSIWA